MPVGVNVLPNDYVHALSICAVTGARFVQLDHVTGTFTNAESVNRADYLLHRATYPALPVLGGIHPKYYRLQQPEPKIAASAREVVDNDLAEAIVVTGMATGAATNLAELREVRDAVDDFPIVVGSGLTPENAKAQFAYADAAIVGTAFKKRGVQRGERISTDMVEAMMRVVLEIRDSRSQV